MDPVPEDRVIPFLISLPSRTTAFRETAVTRAPRDPVDRLYSSEKFRWFRNAVALDRASPTPTAWGPLALLRTDRRLSLPTTTAPTRSKPIHSREYTYALPLATEV